MKGIQTHIVYVPYLDRADNPAECNIKTGEIRISSELWPLYSEFEQKYIKAHEQAHFDLQTVLDEIACDEIAFQALAGTEKDSLIQYVKAVEKVAKNDIERVNAAIKRSLYFAADKGSKEAKKLIKELKL